MAALRRRRYFGEPPLCATSGHSITAHYANGLRNELTYFFRQEKRWCSTGRTRACCAKIGSGFARQSLAKCKMTTSSAKIKRTITAAEVQEWVGKSSKSMMGKAQFREIAAGLTSYRWPADPPPPPGSPWVPREADTDSNRWWDFAAVTEAAKTLLKNAPAMLSHWEGQHSTIRKSSHDANACAFFDYSRGYLRLAA